MMVRRLVCIVFCMMIQCAHAADQATLHRGAVFFMNYCSGCHTLRYFRPDSLTGNRSLMTTSLPEPDARQWFGRMPPDLSLTAREHGPTWLYTYLTSFYPDKTRPFGANNTLVPDVAMPNVLYPLTGHIQLDGDVRDVVAFLVYVAEPARRVRYRTGVWVLLFVGVLGILIHQLNVLYWRKLR